MNNDWKKISDSVWKHIDNNWQIKLDDNSWDRWFIHENGLNIYCGCLSDSFESAIDIVSEDLEPLNNDELQIGSDGLLINATPDMSMWKQNGNEGDEFFWWKSNGIRVTLESDGLWHFYCEDLEFANVYDEATFETLEKALIYGHMNVSEYIANGWADSY